jgi:outer membrane protein OmpA-like peptidoglycan-associated protein
MKTMNTLVALVLMTGLAACQRPAAHPTTLNQGEVGEETEATEAGGEETAPAAAAATASGCAGPNTSTTLGDGTSGMYTGGDGTYGGRATWGSSACGPATDAAPAPAAEPAAEEPAAESHPPIRAVGKAKIEGDEIKLPGKVHFDFDKAKIKEDKETKEILETLVAVMKENPEITKLRIEGHTDNKGTSEYNHKLSHARADSIADWLAKHGVDRGRLTTIGLGEEKPIAPNDTDEHREQNRRTEFKVWEYDGKPTDLQKAASH